MDTSPEPFQYNPLQANLNQSDVSERSSQVSMMRVIYSSCSGVLVYFGPDDALVPPAVDIMFHSGTINTFDLPPENLFTAVDKGLVLSHPLRKIIHKYPQGLEALAYFYSRPYWSRIWIVQEIAVSHRVTVYWGHRVINWESCLHFTGMLMNYVSYIRGSTEYKNKNWQTIDAGLNFAAEVCKVYRLLKTGDECPLLGLLQDFWLTEAGDPKG
jgi:hypothetical protein